jgi:hypothetical protein
MKNSRYNTKMNDGTLRDGECLKQTPAYYFLEEIWYRVAISKKESRKPTLFVTFTTFQTLYRPNRI